MRKFHNTPQLRTVTHDNPQLTGKDLLYKLEDDYQEYRKDCSLGLCKSDPAIHEDFKFKIAKAKLVS